MSNVAVGREPVPAEGSAPPGAYEPVLAIPEGWVIDELARDRMARQLARAPAHIGGVVAETDPLPPGASYRVHAERLCVRPLSAATETTRCSSSGAVLVRPGIPFEVGQSRVELDGVGLLVDPGAHVHDPWRDVAPLEVASPLGRPPFPRRPVVVFSACEPEVEALDWARSMVNNLVRRDVEGRLAMYEVAEGLHLTRPCLPTAESIRALSPDVIVALDQPAMDRLSVWSRDDRSVVAIELVPDVATATELVSWQLERAHGRLRARIGRRTDAPTLVSLVNRLCSGPHPSPPTDAAPPAAVSAPARAPVTRAVQIPAPSVDRSVVVLTGRRDSARHTVLDGLVDHLNGAGHAAHRLPIGSRGAGSMHAADIVVIAGADERADIDAVIEARRRAGRPTIAHIEAPDISIDMWSAAQKRHVDDVALEIAAACEKVTTSSTAVHALVRAVGVRAQLLPPMVTRQHAAELRGARAARNLFADPVIGWNPGSAGTPAPDYLESVADALLEVMEEQPHVVVEIAGEPSHVPAQLLADRNVSALRQPPGADSLSGWTMHVWTPPLVEGGVADGTLALVKAGAVGIPSVLPEPVLTTVGGYPSPGLLVEGFRRADDWATSFRVLLDDQRERSRLSREAMQRFDTAHGPTSSDVAVNRFLGWALYWDPLQ